MPAGAAQPPAYQPLSRYALHACCASTLPCSIYRRQLASAVERAAAATAAAAGPSTSAAAAAAPPPSGGAASVSFFDLAARLRRPEAVKLFYQTLVSHTLGVVRARQDEPYGDLTITVGRYF